MFRIFVLGAGFSAPAGLPLGPQLFAEVRSRAKASLGHANHLERDLLSYQEYLRACLGREVSLEAIDYEEFLAYLDLEHFLGLRGSDTWSDQGNESQIVVKRLIGQVLWSHSPQRMPDLYLSFAQQLHPTDIVLTFNYDTLLERALDEVGKPYRLFPQRFARLGSNAHFVDTSREEVVVLKMHGSIDWFSRTSFAERLALRDQGGFSYEVRDPIFGSAAVTGVSPIVDGPRGRWEPLSELYRATDLAGVYRAQTPLGVPFLLSPSFAKFVYLPRLESLWFGLGNAGALNMGIVVIGYSLPAYDQYAKQALYSVTRNFTLFQPDLEFGGRKKTKIKIVDYRPTEASKAGLHDAYRFVPPNWSEYWYDGFSEAAIVWLSRQKV
jgi:SIR2-like protein